jgi:hypothetical protein
VRYALAVTLPYDDEGLSRLRHDSLPLDFQGTAASNERVLAKAYEKMMDWIGYGVAVTPVIFSEEGLFSTQEQNRSAADSDLAGLLRAGETYTFKDIPGVGDYVTDAWGFLHHDVGHHEERAVGVPASVKASPSEDYLEARRQLLDELLRSIHRSIEGLPPELRSAAWESHHDRFFDLWHERASSFEPEALLENLHVLDRSGFGLRGTYEILKLRGFKADAVMAKTCWDTFRESHQEALEAAIARRSVDAGLLERINHAADPAQEADE